MAFRIGQKVVCINNSNGFCEKSVVCPLIVGGVYSVVEINSESLWCDGDKNHAWHHTRFRPLIEKSTDTGFAILEEIRRRETIPADRVTAPKEHTGERLS